MQLFAAKRVVLILYHVYNYTCILYRTDFTIDMTLHMSLLSFQVCELDIIFNFEKVRCLCLKLYGKTMYIYIYIYFLSWPPTLVHHISGVLHSR